MNKKFIVLSECHNNFRFRVLFLYLAGDGEKILLFSENGINGGISKMEVEIKYFIHFFIVVKIASNWKCYEKIIIMLLLSV